MLITRVLYRQNFSVLNKVRRHQKNKTTGQLNFPVTKSHIIDDFVGQSSYEAQKINLSPHQKYLIETKAMERPFTGMFWA